MQTPVIFVIGPPGHGKTTARQLLAKLTSQRGESTSTVILQFLALRRGLKPDALKALPKEEIRAALIEAGDFMVGKIDKITEAPVNDTLDHALYRIPSGLVRTLYMNGANIIDGVRRISELGHAIDHLEWNGVRSITIWIEKSGGPVIPDNTELTALHADETVFNDGTPEDLEKKLYDVLCKYFGDQDDTKKEIPVAASPAEAVATATEAKAPTKDDLS